MSSTSTVNDHIMISVPELTARLELTFQVSEVDPVPVVEGVEAEAEVEEAESTPPIVTASLVISKHGHPNAMSIDLDAGEDGLVISNVAMFERSVAVQKGSEGDWARRERYLGPRTCPDMRSAPGASYESIQGQLLQG